ncbi:hypothetical protein H1C71_021588 [Ictidomys tridecemlineatus]|nr:hypothetical protein H1C71_021588 [Ictidomys tridecemlineatus]
MDGEASCARCRKQKSGNRVLLPHGQDSECASIAAVSSLVSSTGPLDSYQINEKATVLRVDLNRKLVILVQIQWSLCSKALIFTGEETVKATLQGTGESRVPECRTLCSRTLKFRETSGAKHKIGTVFNLF